jgi:ferritin-like metal-binding protein YciE
MKEHKGSPALDAGLLAAAQAVEHYEISRYGSLIAWAEKLGHGRRSGIARGNARRGKSLGRSPEELAGRVVSARHTVC